MITSMKSSIVAEVEMLAPRLIMSRRRGCYTILVSHQHLAVENLVVAQDVENDFLVQDLRRRLEGNLHTTGFLDFQVDVPGIFVR